MTHVLIHDLPERAQVLLARLRTVVQTGSGDAVADVLNRARLEPSDKPRMVLTGQFSSGKSKLITALTDKAVEPLSNADIATDEVTEYEWNDAVVLVDTPGVQSGVRTHDELALGAIGKAEFVLFVITVNLFDDASRDYLRRLANELQLFGQMIVVITRAGTRPAVEGVRQLAVREALGTATFNLPIAEVDSVLYLRSLESGPNAKPLRERSGIDELRVLINRMSEDRGSLAQLRQPIHLIRQLCDDAQQIFVTDERSRVALRLIAAQRAAISDRRFILERALTGAEAEFRSRCLVDVSGFVDTATSVGNGDEAHEDLARAEARLVDSLERHATRFAESINQLAETQFDTLSEQLLEISESNRIDRLLRPDGDVALAVPQQVREEAPLNATPGTGAPAIDWEQFGQLIRKGRGWWGAGDGLREASGSIGHTIVKEVGHAFGHKFKPWQALKIADKIGKAAKVGGFVLQAGIAGYEVWNSEREARQAQRDSERQHSALTTEIMGHADAIAADARRQLWTIIDPPMRAVLSDLRDAQDLIVNADRARVDATNELRAIAEEADLLLATS